MKETRGSAAGLAYVVYNGGAEAGARSMSQGARRTTATRTEREVDTAARILEQDFFQSVVPRAVTFRARLSSAICALFVIARFDTTNSAIVKGEKLFVSDVLVALLVADAVSGVEGIRGLLAQGARLRSSASPAGTKSSCTTRARSSTGTERSQARRTTPELKSEFRSSPETESPQQSKAH